jgi:hypothetical protein
MGALGTSLRAAITPIARSLTGQLARSIVQVRRAVVTRALNGSELRSWQVVSGGNAVDAPLIDLTREAAAREWGIDANVTAATILPDSLTLLEQDAVVVTGGDEVGRRFRIVEIRPAPMAGLLRVALRETVERIA